MTYSRYNPFKPNSPIFSGMFAGRTKEISRIDEILYQTKLGNPSHILITGIRGIGKSSLLLVANHFAKGLLTWKDAKYNFLTVQISISNELALIDVIRKINMSMKRELEVYEPGKALFEKFWKVIQKVEIGGLKYRTEKQDLKDYELIDEFSFFISDTVKSITDLISLSDSEREELKDGIVILIDEADNAASKLNLGAFLKNLTENLIKEGNSRILIILAGMRPLINILRESHESSLRLFEQFELNPLSPDEVKRIIQNGLEESNSYSAGDRITINGDALDQIVYYSDCYPPFVQQIGYSVFSANTDSLITVEDVENGMYMSGGSLDIIGDKFYSYPYYNRISADSYRQILGIMANKKGTDWLSKKEIGNEFKGKKTELTNGIKALRERDMILSRPGVRGQYRLPWVTFSLWIKKVQNI